MKPVHVPGEKIYFRPEDAAKIIPYFIKAEPENN